MPKRKFFYWLTISNFLYIIVLLILAGITISSLSGDNGILTNASKAKYATELSQYNEELQNYKTNKVLENMDFEEESLFSAENSLEYNTKSDEENGDIYDVIPSLEGSHFAGKFEVIKGELLLNSQDKEEIKVAQSVGIAVNPYEIVEGELISSNGNLLLMDEETGTLRLPESVTSIGEGAFANVEGLKTIIIPGSVKEIKKNAFRSNHTLEKVIIEEGVETIGESAFQECDKLKEVILPDSISSIGEGAFYVCRSLENIEIPSKIKKLPTMIFSSCYSLENVTFRGNEIETIEREAFYGCAIRNFTITNKVNSIDSTTFSLCNNLENFIINNNNFIYESGLLMTKDKENVIFLSTKLLANITEYTIPNGIKNFIVDLSNLNKLTRLNIPDSIENIYTRGLPKNLEEVIINENNKTYKTFQNAIYSKNGENLIYCYSKDKKIEIGDGVKIIEDFSFKGATNLEELILPDSVETIKAQLFYSDKISKIKIGKNTNSINPMFAYYMEIEVEIDKDNPYYMTENQILYTKNKERLITVNYRIKGKFTIDSNVKIIGNNAFYSQNEMSEIDLGENLETIENEAFYNCSGLKTIKIPHSVKTITSNAFAGMDNIKEININNEVNSIQGAPWACPAGMRVIIWNS